MLVSVTERTREIGVRKAIGATSHQILSQFIIESSMISLVGGFVGVILSLLTNLILRIATDLEPVITLPIMGVAVFVPLIVGIVFGAAPALKAARKDPIEALRQM
jgi:putative ABC transport system permease protein